MKPVFTIRTTDQYAGPPEVPGVGGLPIYREHVAELGCEVIWSEWELDEVDRHALRRGGLLNIGVLGERMPSLALRISARDVDTSDD